MTEILWPLTVLLVAILATGAFLVANARKYSSRAARALQNEVNEALNRRLTALEKALDKVDVDDLKEELDALASDVAEITKEGRATPHEAWLTDKLKPLFERINVLTADLSNLKTTFSRYEALKQLGKTVTGSKEG